jgi:mRNA-degrading endonuclease toxin of MazEF toxin-antitoxin module
VPVGLDEGLDREGVATFDNLAAVPRSVLTVRLGQVGPVGRALMCDALRALADC